MNDAPKLACKAALLAGILFPVCEAEPEPELTRAKYLEWTCQKPLLVRPRRVLAVAGEPPAPDTFAAEMRARFPAIHVQEGKPVTLDNGMRLTLRTTGYAHMSDSRNLAIAKVTVSRGDQGESEDWGLVRTLPGPVCYRAIQGVWIGVESEDAYGDVLSAELQVLEEDSSAR